VRNVIGVGEWSHLNGDVHATLDQIDRAVIKTEIQNNIAIALIKLRDAREEGQAAEQRRHHHPQAPIRFLPSALDRGFRVLDVIEYASASHNEVAAIVVK